MIKLDDIFEFTDMLHEFQQVRRQIWVRGEDRRENDWEHSFHTAIMAWYIVDSDDRFELDKEKVIKYALAHDLVEVYAGDTPFREAGDKKDKREKKAMTRLQDEFPEFKELHQAIQAYKDRTNSEAQFVYALDKIIPFFNTYLNGGRSFKTDDVSLEELREHKEDKFHDTPKVEEYYEQLMDLFEQVEDKLFHD